MMSRSLAKELGPYRIRVNTICPGATRTPGAEAQTAAIGATMGLTGEQLLAGFVSRIPLSRMGEPDDIANAVLFLAGEGSAYVTGSTIVVDGGFLAS
jgi:NAD(P)-dependent dehydrogenase (short-subunit alcohol dehydrogenase family)